MKTCFQILLYFIIANFFGRIQADEFDISNDEIFVVTIDEKTTYSDYLIKAREAAIKGSYEHVRLVRKNDNESVLIKIPIADYEITTPWRSYLLNSLKLEMQTKSISHKIDKKYLYIYCPSDMCELLNIKKLQDISKHNNRIIGDDAFVCLAVICKKNDKMLNILDSLIRTNSIIDGRIEFVER